METTTPPEEETNIDILTEAIQHENSGQRAVPQPKSNNKRIKFIRLRMRADHMLKKKSETGKRNADDRPSMNIATTASTTAVQTDPKSNSPLARQRTVINHSC